MTNTKIDAENPKTAEDFRANYRHPDGIIPRFIECDNGVSAVEKKVFIDFCDTVLAPFDALMQDYRDNRSDIQAGTVLASGDFVITHMLTQMVRMATANPTDYGDSLGSHISGISTCAVSILSEVAVQDMRDMGMSSEERIKAALSKALGIDPAKLRAPKH